MDWKSASKVRALSRRRCALSLEQAISIGFRSGLSGGRKSNQLPCAFRTCCACADLWDDRLSAITTPPGWSVGASRVSIQVSNAARSIGPTSTQGALSSLMRRPAMKVWVRPLSGHCRAMPCRAVNDQRAHRPPAWTRAEIGHAGGSSWW